MALPAKDAHYTFADCMVWDESEWTEIIDGRAVMMAPPSRIHQAISGELFRQLANYLEGKKCRVYHAPFAVRLFEQDGDTPEDVDTMVEPDISVVCDLDKLDKYGCKGAPSMVAEIISPSTRRHDRLFISVLVSVNTGSLTPIHDLYKCFCRMKAGRLGSMRTMAVRILQRSMS